MIKLLKHGYMLLAALMIAAVLTGCGQGEGTTSPVTTTAAPTDAPTPTPTPEPTPTPTPTPRPILTVTTLLPGEEPKGLAAVFEVLNERLAADIFGSLKVSWTPQDDYADAIAAAVAAGSVDFAWIGSSVLTNYADKQLILPLDELIASFGQPILDNTPEQVLETVKIGGKLMAIPGAGNMPLCDTANVLVVRDDLRLKYGLDQLDSLTDVEGYFKAVATNDPNITPVSASNAAFAVMKAYGNEEILAGTNNSVAYLAGEDGAVTCVSLQDAKSFKSAAARVRTWYKAGWLPKAMPSVKDPAAAFKNGTAATLGSRAMAAVSLTKTIVKKVPDAVLSEVPVFGKVKYLSGNGGNVLCLSAAGKNPETAVQFWAWVLSSQDNYDLFCYGVENENFEISNDRITMLNEDYSAFPALFQNMNFRRFPAGVSDEYIQLLKSWNDGALPDPLMGFVFDTQKVKNELAKVKSVYALYGAALQTGSTDTDTLLKEFAARMKAAGQDKIVAEAQAQVNEFLASKK